VDFYYRDGEQQALSDINLVIDEGQKIAIVGFSGAGKSTLVDLLPRFIDPHKGVVRIGGVDIAQVGIKELRNRIAVVGQHTFLFNDTIRNNIAYGSEGASVEAIEEAAKAAFAHDFILQLPRGYETVIGEAGLSLSGGERQRIAIARAILKRAPILILDEATASLDNRAEREVQSALEALERGKTSVVIAHRLSTVRNADLIVVLKDGRIVETGTHDELLKMADGEYTKLYALQFAASAERPEVDEALIN
jgi:ATP-binding cassette, subfamily B, bacterial MsbA